MLKSKKHKWDLYNILVVSPREQNQIETFAPDFQIVLLRKISNSTETISLTAVKSLWFVIKFLQEKTELIHFNMLISAFISPK